MNKKEQNKMLRNTLIILGVVIISFVFFIIVSNALKNFEYRGVKFSVVKFCDAGPPCLITYNTKLPVVYQGKSTDYNFFLRNDPRELEKEVPFDGEVVLRNKMDVNITFNTACNGLETIAVENFLKLHRIAGINISNDNNKGCDLTGGKMYLSIQESNQTSIEQFGPACYRINVKECEILKGTERFMIETFVEIDKTL